MGAPTVSETVASEIDISASPERVLEVLCDFESYPKWARSMKKASIVESDEDGRASKVEFHVAPGLLPEMRYVLHYSYSDDGITWDYVEGEPLKDISGSYRVEGNGDSTHVTYNLAIEPGIPLPGFVKARAAREISRIALKELKRRVEGR
jgi:uncharacterized protein YndB with AHSA1/START domain